MIKLHQAGRAAAAAVIAATAAAHADTVTVYNNFGPGSNGFQYSSGVSWMIAGPGSGFNTVRHAQSFTPSQSGNLSDIYLGVGQVLPTFGGHSFQLTVRLAERIGNNPPTMDDVMEEWVITSLPHHTSTPVAHLVSQNNLPLEAGLNYWIWIEPGPGVSAAWGHVDAALPFVPRIQGSWSFVTGLWQWGDLNTARAGAMRVDIGTGAEPGGCNPADLAEPFGVLDVFDVLAFLDLFEQQDPDADLAEPFGTFDVFDVLTFLAIFEQGCP